MISRAVVLQVARVERRAGRGVSSGQPSVANGQSADENHVSSTSVVARRARPSRTRRTPSGSVSATVDVPVRAVPDRELVAPPELARDAPVGRVLERVDREAVLRLGVEADAAARAAPRAPASSAPPSSTTTAARSAARSASRSARRARPCGGTARASRAGRAPCSQARIRSSASSWVRPASSPASLVHAPVGADHRRLGQAVVAADLEVGRVVAGRDLERAGAELGLDALVGDHRHAALDERDDHLLADQRRGSARRPGCTATATSARIVAGRTVAIVMCPSPSASG